MAHGGTDKRTNLKTAELYNYMKYSLKTLEAMPTLHQGHTDDLKVDQSNKRVWLSRLTIEDGMPYNNQVVIEERKAHNGIWQSWQTVEEYEAK